MVPASDGTLYVSIPDEGGTILTRLDASGDSAAGWPIVLDGTTFCGRLMPASDGSIRVLCHVAGEFGEGFQPERAYAFAADARPLDGWALFGSVRDRGLVLH